MTSDPGMVSFWFRFTGRALSQGDLLPGCFMPLMPPDFGPSATPFEAPTTRGDLIVLTQSCDLENMKAGLVALSPIHKLADFEAVNPAFSRKGVWEEVRRGRREGLHLLGSPTNPASGRDALVVNFRDIYSLPIAYLQRHAEDLGPRWRLQSPYLEHFSQTFARFFMRVGLPSEVPKIND